jgi:hypothetical protein
MWKIAVSAALVLGTASAALAASKHYVRHEQTAVRERVVTPGYGYDQPRHTPGYYEYGYAQPGRGTETYIGIQDEFFRRSQGE